MPCRVVKPGGSASALARISVAAWASCVPRPHASRVPRCPERGRRPDSVGTSVRRGNSLGRCLRTRSAVLVASCHFGPSRDPDAKPGTAEVFSLNVHPDDWRRGVGSQLTTFALNRLRAEGFACVTLWVLRDNARAQRFYEARAFSATTVSGQRAILSAAPFMNCATAWLLSQRRDVSSTNHWV